MIGQSVDVQSYSASNRNLTRLINGDIPSDAADESTRVLNGRA